MLAAVVALALLGQCLAAPPMAHNPAKRDLYLASDGSMILTPNLVDTWPWTRTWDDRKIEMKWVQPEMVVSPYSAFIEEPLLLQSWFKK